MSEITEYLERGLELSRAIREKLIKQGKTYRSHRVAFQNGYITGMQDTLDKIKQPERERQLQDALTKLTR